MNAPRSVNFVTRYGAHTFEWGRRTYVMGIVNATPDSFSGDGLGGDLEAALAQAHQFAAEGADILDVGGESTRPGSEPVSAEEESHRVVPLVRSIAAKIPLPVSIDTYKGQVARQAVDAGAVMLNDVWGLKLDPSLADVAAERGLPIILNHNQRGAAYKDLIAEVFESLQASIDLARKRGVPRENIIIDPGFGFGKTAEQNLEVLRRLTEFRPLGQPILVGASRKSTIGLVLDLAVDQRLEGTLAITAIAIANGADIVRVHDVKENVRVARMTDAIVRGWKAPK